MINWLRKLMYGRYGSDPLNTVLLLLCLALFLAGELAHIPLLVTLAIALIVLVYFRMFSRNTQARYAENQKFLGWFAPITRKLANKRAQFSDRKSHRYMKCPSCRTVLRVPRGKGKISISCPKCHHSFLAKS